MCKKSILKETSEEERFLQAVLNGQIKTYSHKQVIDDLRKVLKR